MTTDVGLRLDEKRMSQAFSPRIFFPFLLHGHTHKQHFEKKEENRRKKKNGLISIFKQTSCTLHLDQEALLTFSLASKVMFPSALQLAASVVASLPLWRNTCAAGPSTPQPEQVRVL